MDQINSHLLVCFARPTEKPRWYSEDINKTKVSFVQEKTSLNESCELKIETNKARLDAFLELKSNIEIAYNQYISQRGPIPLIQLTHVVMSEKM